jgi:hypothetical protein
MFTHISPLSYYTRDQASSLGPPDLSLYDNDVLYLKSGVIPYTYTCSAPLNLHLPL